MPYPNAIGTTAVPNTYLPHTFTTSSLALKGIENMSGPPPAVWWQAPTVNVSAGKPRPLPDWLKPIAAHRQARLMETLGDIKHSELTRLECRHLYADGEVERAEAAPEAYTRTYLQANGLERHEDAVIKNTHWRGAERVKDVCRVLALPAAREPAHAAAVATLEASLKAYLKSADGKLDATLNGFSTDSISKFRKMEDRLSGLLEDIGGAEVRQQLFTQLEPAILRRVQSLNPDVCVTDIYKDLGRYVNTESVIKLGGKICEGEPMAVLREIDKILAYLDPAAAAEPADRQASTSPNASPTAGYPNPYLPPTYVVNINPTISPHFNGGDRNVGRSDNDRERHEPGNALDRTSAGIENPLDSLENPPRENVDPPRESVNPPRESLDPPRESINDPEHADVPGQPSLDDDHDMSERRVDQAQPRPYTEDGQSGEPSALTTLAMPQHLETLKYRPTPLLFLKPVSTPAKNAIVTPVAAESSAPVTQQSGRRSYGPRKTMEDIAPKYLSGAFIPPKGTSLGLLHGRPNLGMAVPRPYAAMDHYSTQAEFRNNVPFDRTLNEPGNEFAFEMRDYPASLPANAPNPDNQVFVFMEGRDNAVKASRHEPFGPSGFYRGVGGMRR